MKDKRLLIIFLTVFIDLVGFGIIIPMNPYLADAYGASPFQVGVLMSIYSLMQFIFSPVWGQLSDRMGRRPIIILSLFGAGISHLAFAFAPSFLALLAARAFAGIFGGNLPAAMAYIADITEAKDRSKSMGLIGAAFGLGFILGPAIGGLTSEWGMRLGDHPPLGGSFPAVIASAICLLNALFAVRFLPESLQDKGRNATAFSHSLRWKKLWACLTQPTLNVVMIIYFLSGFGLAHVEQTLFLLMKKEFGWSQAQSSYGFAYIGLIMVFTQGYLIRKLMPKFGERRLLLAGMLMAGLGLLSIANVSSLWWIAVGVTFLGLGNGLANPSLNGTISLLSARDEQGNSLGVAQSLSSMARILGPPTGGFLFERLVQAPFVAGGCAVLIGFALAWVVRGRLPAEGYGHH